MRGEGVGRERVLVSCALRDARHSRDPGQCAMLAAKTLTRRLCLTDAGLSIRGRNGNNSKTRLGSVGVE